MAPSKPSVQTQILLSAMDEQANLDMERWDSINENFDLLFSKVEEVDRNQQKLEAKFDVSTIVMEQMIRDQETLASS
jgi:hypothetical protein